ncbi:hypothetical protein QTQ03_17475 [Micromonospora sp. WMMA1363]|uniref:hypothetical protein n=1 Tax=Micromonospora sp. WMMA1363 TaxID=3053985 RepID=UPI00259C94AC|nr:hypothetical protein [Micromonospora sp. WMMA1363]MDM4721306.1 hypothetical protein [Micromonospora sp. WMMA1363]
MSRASEAGPGAPATGGARATAPGDRDAGGAAASAPPPVPRPPVPATLPAQPAPSSPATPVPATGHSPALAMAGGEAGWEQVERRARASQSFWTAVVGVPTIFSVLRLGVEAGGELQTTLLLVANVGPINLLAGFLTTTARLLSTALVAVFALGAVLAASVRNLPPGRRRPLFARWTEVTPAWFVAGSFLMALVTWPLLYLPLLVPALAAAFQLWPGRLYERAAVRVMIVVAVFAAYLWLLVPTLRDAWRQEEALAIVLLVVAPLLALAIAGPLPGMVIRPLATVTQVAVLAMLVWVALPVISTPVLPLTVTTVGAAAGATENIRGHVVTTDDVNMVILQERGGVRYVPVDQVRGQVLCPTEEELPRHRLRVHDFHVEDSLLEGLGRRVRPVHRIDAACR